MVIKHLRDYSLSVLSVNESLFLAQSQWLLMDIFEQMNKVVKLVDLGYLAMTRTLKQILSVEGM